MLAQSFPCALSSIRNGEGAYGWAYPGFTTLDRKENDPAPAEIGKA